MGQKQFEPTPAEKLFIWRRRASLSQAEAAAKFSVSRNRYTQWERIDGVAGDIPARIRNSTPHLQPHELCVLKRRRAGATQSAVAEDLELCRYWVNLMETGKEECSSLVEYWS